MREFAETRISELQANGYLLSSDPALLDFAVIHDFLTTSYWSPGITAERVRLAAENSITFGIYWANGAMGTQEQVAYGRVLTDYVALAYLLDVFVLPAHRGKGLASWLTQAALAHSDLVNVRSWMLATMTLTDFMRSMASGYLRPASTGGVRRNEVRHHHAL